MNLAKRLRKYVKGLAPCDFIVVIAVLILIITGIVMVFSASYYKSINETGSAYAYLRKQAFFGVTGCILMYVSSLVDYHRIRKLTPAFTIVSFLLLFAIFTPLGITVNGATRWLNVGITLMPGEIAKLAMILFAAASLSVNEKQIKSFQYNAFLIAVAGICAGLIVKQPNLSTALTVVGIVGFMMLVAGFDLRLAGGFVGLGLLAMLALSQTGTYWGKRLTSFVDPFADAKGDGYQAVQSLLALGTGGLKGLGLGQSIQKNLYLPEPQNDFILAIIGEELGLIRILLMLLLFVFLIWRCFLIAMHAQDKYGMYLAAGVTSMIGLQLILNIAVVTSSMPPTGIALPFVGYGGNAIWMFMIAVGILLNVSRTADTPPLFKKKDPDEKENARARRRQERGRKERKI